MKVLAAVFLTTLVYVSNGVRLPDPSWAVEVKQVSNSRLKRLGDDPAPVPDPDPALCKNKIFSCDSCTASRVCRYKSDNSIIPYKVSACPADRPYCDSSSGSCVQTAPLECGEPDDFVCLEKNHYFPDPDCTKFHYCDDKYKSTLFKCIGDGNVYNADSNKCVTSTECGKFDCTNNALKKMKHNLFPRYFAMCKSEDNADGPIVVGVCPSHYQVNPKTQLCEPDCVAHGNGNIPYSGNCRKYWSCTEKVLPDGSNFMEVTDKSCYENYSFDSTLFMCVPDPDNTICPKA